MVCDCGGGTVDASTFSVTNTVPLKLGDPICDPTGMYNPLNLFATDYDSD